jgi:hypothetical protein
MIMAMIILIYVRHKEFFKKKQLIILSASFICGTFGYAFMMSVMYMFCFSDGEMKVLARYNRYMASYVLAEVLIVLAIYIRIISEEKDVFKNVKKFIVVTMCLLFMLGESLIYMAPQVLRENTREIYEKYATQLREKVESESKVFVIYDAEKTDQKWYGAVQVYINYYVNDISIDYKYNNSYVMNLSDSNTKNSLVDEIMNNDYLYVLDVNDNVNNLSYLSGEALKEKTIYKINKDDPTLPQLIEVK